VSPTGEPTSSSCVGGCNDITDCTAGQECKSSSSTGTGCGQCVDTCTSTCDAATGCSNLGERCVATGYSAITQSYCYDCSTVCSNEDCATSTDCQHNSGGSTTTTGTCTTDTTSNYQCRHCVYVTPSPVTPSPTGVPTKRPTSASCTNSCVAGTACPNLGERCVATYDSTAQSYCYECSTVCSNEDCSTASDCTHTSGGITTTGTCTADTTSNYQCHHCVYDTPSPTTPSPTAEPTSTTTCSSGHACTTDDDCSSFSTLGWRCEFVTAASSEKCCQEMCSDEDCAVDGAACDTHDAAGVYQQGTCTTDASSNYACKACIADATTPSPTDPDATPSPTTTTCSSGHACTTDDDCSGFNTLGWRCGYASSTASERCCQRMCAYEDCQVDGAACDTHNAAGVSTQGTCTTDSTSNYACKACIADATTPAPTTSTTTDPCPNGCSSHDDCKSSAHSGTCVFTNAVGTVANCGYCDYTSDVETTDDAVETTETTEDDTSCMDDSDCGDGYSCKLSSVYCKPSSISTSNDATLNCHGVCVEVGSFCDSADIGVTGAFYQSSATDRSTCRYCMCSDQGARDCDALVDAFDNADTGVADLFAAICSAAEYPDLQDADGEQCAAENVVLKDRDDITQCWCDAFECSSFGRGSAANKHAPVMAVMGLVAALVLSCM